eukprot:scaffold26116_cov74-Phaeocystis_antarctica.AAC.6
MKSPFFTAARAHRALARLRLARFPWRSLPKGRLMPALFHLTGPDLGPPLPGAHDTRPHAQCGGLHAARRTRAWLNMSAEPSPFSRCAPAPRRARAAFSFSLHRNENDGGGERGKGLL